MGLLAKKFPYARLEWHYRPLQRFRVQSLQKACKKAEDPNRFPVRVSKSDFQEISRPHYLVIAVQPITNRL